MVVKTVEQCIENLRKLRPKICLFRKEIKN